MKKPEFRKAGVHAVEDLFEREAGFDLGEKCASGVVVDGTAVVGIDEVKSPEFAALVGVGDTGSDAIEERLGEAVYAAGSEDHANEFIDSGDEFGAVVEPIDESVEGVFKFLVMLRPRGVLLGFSNCFFHVGVEAVGLNGPRADEGLVEEVLGVAIGEIAGFEWRILASPAAEKAAPVARGFSDDGETRTDIIRTLGVVGGESGHGGWPR